MARANLWAPWRIEYIRGLPAKKSDCFICDAIKAGSRDDLDLVLWRTGRCIVVLNRYPYNNGHLLIAPVRHIADLQSAEDEELAELMKLVVRSQEVLSAAIGPHGFNVGMNFGRCAGAGLPQHLHIHVVPRWEGDTNFMSVCTDTDVIGQSLSELLEQLKGISAEQDLPGLE
jgi:ATP adenylyltransferase